MLPIDQPLLSDHSSIAADVRCASSSRASVTLHQVRNWRGFDIEAFADDVTQSDLFTQLLADVSEAFNCCVRDVQVRTDGDKACPDALVCALVRQ